MIDLLGNLQEIRELMKTASEADRENEKAEKAKFLERLRDNFAMEAMQKCLEEVQMIPGSKLQDGEWTQCDQDLVAEASYRMADAMMRRRLFGDPHSSCVPCDDPCAPDDPSIKIGGGGGSCDAGGKCNFDGSVNKTAWHKGPLPPFNGELVLVKFSVEGQPVIVAAYMAHVRVTSTGAERTSSSVHSWCEIPK